MRVFIYKCIAMASFLPDVLLSHTLVYMSCHSYFQLLSHSLARSLTFSHSTAIFIWSTGQKHSAEYNTIFGFWQLSSDEYVSVTSNCKCEKNLTFHRRLYFKRKIKTPSNTNLCYKTSGLHLVHFHSDLLLIFSQLPFYVGSESISVKSKRAVQSNVKDVFFANEQAAV